ncbi:hypothetical protein [Klebsiella sp. A52]|nr:hypothetical protein [Klebsiella sp. A52]
MMVSMEQGRLVIEPVRG